MKSILKVLVISALTVTFSSCGSSSDQSGNPDQPGTTTTLYYMTASSIPVGTWLSAPPAAGSVEERADLDAILELQASRTDADCKRANTEVSISLNSFYGPDYGPLSKKEVSAVKALFDKVMNDADYAAATEKAVWQRPRPFKDDARIQPCVKLEPTFSYPSGHSTIAHTTADVLDLIFPERKTQIDARADQIAHDRSVGGVHFLTDLAAGKLMSDRVFQAIEWTAAFQQDLKNAQAAVAKSSK